MGAAPGTCRDVFGASTGWQPPNSCDYTASLAKAGSWISVALVWHGKVRQGHQQLLNGSLVGYWLRISLPKEGNPYCYPQAYRVLSLAWQRPITQVLALLLPLQDFCVGSSLHRNALFLAWFRLQAALLKYFLLGRASPTSTYKIVPYPSLQSP